MTEAIHFGPRSITLLVGALNGLVIAALLLAARTNRAPNRLLAALLLVVVLRMVPFVIGYAGFYDAYPWLSFAPYNLSLALGPLVWLYVRALATGAMPRRWWMHLMPALAQLVYYGVVFSWSVADKSRWDTIAHRPYIVPVESLATWMFLAVYLLRAHTTFRALQSRLDATLSNREEFRLPWLRLVLGLMLATLAFWIVLSAVDRWVRPLDYFDMFPMYVWWALLVYALGLGGWRQASTPIPVAALPEPTPVAESSTMAAGATEPAARPAPPGQDWRALGTAWAARTETAGWWRDPDLTLALLARHLVTNTSYLSRALNDGLGESFNGFVNRLRIEAVQAELRDPASTRDVLAIALDAGFRSKASFNRVFRDRTGTTPTAYRRAAREEPRDAPRDGDA